ncbi:peptidase M14, partial [bacterium]
RVDTTRTVEFAGVAYEALTSEVTGGEYVRFLDQPEMFELEWWDTLRPGVTAQLPEAYLVPPEWTDVLRRLDDHGVTYRRLAASVELEVRTWRFSDAQWGQQPYEGHHTVEFESESFTETRLFPAGTAVVDLNQRTARVAAHLLEPRAPDSLVQWGLFDAIFSRVEYVESYVIEAMIPQLLADNPQWAAELEEAKAADPEFAADPWAIRYWFYERTPWYDQRVNIYPVGYLDDRADVDSLPLK